MQKKVERGSCVIYNILKNIFVHVKHIVLTIVLTITLVVTHIMRLIGEKINYDLKLFDFSLKFTSTFLFCKFSKVIKFI